MKKVVLLSTLLVLAACQQVKENLTAERLPADINKVADQYIANRFSFFPEEGTFYQIKNADNVSLSDITPDGIRRVELAEDALYASLKSIDPQQLDKNEMITYQLLKTDLEGSINQRVCQKHLWSINHLDAFYTWYRYIGQTQPVGDVASRADALARWARIPDYIRADMANNKRGLALGYALPRPIIERVIGQMEQLLASPIESNVFYMPALRDGSADFQQQIKSRIETDIMPAIDSYLAFIKDEYLERARPDLSITAIPNGDACYAAMLSAATTLSNSPADIFAWGEQAIAERETVITTLGQKLYGTSDLTIIKNRLSDDPSNYFESKAELLGDAQAAIDRARVESRPYFNLFPKADVILKPISEIEEKTGYSRYLPASDDGTRPATYIQATFAPEKKLRGVVEKTAFHETYPGHHLQIAISRELVRPHPVTKYIGNSGFMEGWARYAETLSDEIGLYSSDYHRIAMYMRLPTGMVVDPGIHFRNWSREEAIGYTMSKQTSMTREDAERYVDRISVWPGQMTTYGVGERFFINLRKQAADHMGDAFDIKAFHDVCLQNGSVPLDFVSAEVAQYLRGGR